MLNLGEYDLIPFKTKARTRSGVVVIYVGPVLTFRRTTLGGSQPTPSMDLPTGLRPTTRPSMVGTASPMVLNVLPIIVAIAKASTACGWRRDPHHRPHHRHRSGDRTGFGNEMDYVDYVSEREFVITRIGQRQDRTVYKFVSDHCEDFGDLLWGLSAHSALSFGGAE